MELSSKTAFEREADADVEAQVRSTAGGLKERVDGAKESEGIWTVSSVEDLRAAFSKCQQAYEAVENSEKGGGDVELQDECKKCLGMLQLCEEAVRRLGVFSKNEIALDVNTEDLAYLLINYYSGKLCLKIMPQDPSGKLRHEVVTRGKQFLEFFLEQCLSMEVMDSSDRMVFLSYQEKTQPPQLARELKMERFKQSRAAKQRLAELAARLKLIQGRGEADEDMEREEQILNLSCAIKNALDDFESCIQEEQILEHMAKMSLRFTNSTDNLPTPPPPKDIVVTRIDKSLNMTRETLKAQVFRPSWSQPTMSLEEYAEIEMQQLLEREKREKEHALNNPEILTGQQVYDQGLEENEEVVDKATKKDRDWDDWKDDHPKGRGVTKRF